MAQSTNRPDADRPEAGPAAIGPDSDPGVGPDEMADDGLTAEQDPALRRALWEDLRIDPVEIALPAGVGYTLRAYRPDAELTPTDISEREEDDPFAARRRAGEATEEDEDDETVVILDEEFAAALEAEEQEQRDAGGGKRTDRADADQTDGAETDGAETDEPPIAPGDGDGVPIFLTHRGRLLLFKNPESLVSYVRSGAPNDLAQLDTWADLADRIQPADVLPLAEDTYELDLVVENLRGGHDVWDASLLIQSGEIARDLAYALRLPSVLDMLSAGSSLDDLDEALRSTVDGGIGKFMARRRLKKIGAQTASLGWRTIIGKISAAADWRD